MRPGTKDPTAFRRHCLMAFSSTGQSGLLAALVRLQALLVIIAVVAAWQLLAFTLRACLCGARALRRAVVTRRHS
ncbi:hypothetical protein [Paucibacter soli]|uniref:hypothetical protein n=1 Tax=Paucibacter soli TaxID=3133433 RepID=UPI0030A2E703